MVNIGAWLFKKYGLYTIIFSVVGAICVWGLAHWAAAPGSEVSILWGLAKYEKRVPGPIPKSSVKIDLPDDSYPQTSSDANVVAVIRREASELLKRTRSAPGGLWLMAEATTSSREDLLHIADQLKSESRPEALAHLAYTLTVFDRPGDALYVAERSLAAIDDVPEGIRRYSLDDLAVTFAEAQLVTTALKAVEQALAQAKASGETLGLSRLVRVLVRISSVSYGLTAARGIEDPKARSDALSAIVDELIKDGQNHEAGQVFQEALSTSLKIPEASDRASALADRTRELSRLGRYDESTKLAKQAKEEALKIDKKELLGELTTKIIRSDMSLFELPPDVILQIANSYKKPDILVRLAPFMPKRSVETARVIEGALAMATKAQDPVVLADVSKLLEDTGSPDEGAKSAKRATEIALQSNNPRTRQATLRKTSEILARTGDFEAAFAAADGIDNVKYSAEVVAKLLSRCYAQKGRPGRKVSETLSRAYRASDNLRDKDRSEVLMHLAVSQALLGNFAEAYRIGKLAPFSGHRLAAYSIVVLRYELQRSPDLEEQLRSAHDEALMVMLAPIFAWSGLVD